MLGAVNRFLHLLIAALMVTACAGPSAQTPTRSLEPGEQRVPVANWTAGLVGGPVLCAGVGYPSATAILHGSATDPRLVWMSRLAKRVELGWPVGYSARFTPQLELLDEHGVVVGREGSILVGGCETADAGVFSVELH